jgi:hypothetical protein
MFLGQWQGQYMYIVNDILSSSLSTDKPVISGINIFSGYGEHVSIQTYGGGWRSPSGVDMPYLAKMKSPVGRTRERWRAGEGVTDGRLNVV